VIRGEACYYHCTEGEGVVGRVGGDDLEDVQVLCLERKTR
jgi:hypothetical protein